MSVPSMVKLPYAAMAYVAKDNTNELLITTSDDGDHWSAGQRTGHSIKMAPAPATLQRRSG